MYRVFVGVDGTTGEPVFFISRPFVIVKDLNEGIYFEIVVYRMSDQYSIFEQFCDLLLYNVKRLGCFKYIRTAGGAC